MIKFYLCKIENSNITACDPSHLLELKNLIFCNKQWYGKIKLRETIHRKKISWNESYRLVIPHPVFFIFFKNTMTHLKLSLYRFMFIKKTILWKLCIPSPHNYWVTFVWSLHFSYKVAHFKYKKNTK